MTRCPKCNGSNIAGPRYVRFGFRELLEYRCITCGYTEDTPTHDAKEPSARDFRGAMAMLGGIVGKTTP